MTMRRGRFHALDLGEFLVGQCNGRGGLRLLAVRAEAKHGLPNIGQGLRRVLGKGDGRREAEAERHAKGCRLKQGFHAHCIFSLGYVVFVEGR